MHLRLQVQHQKKESVNDDIERQREREREMKETDNGEKMATILVHSGWNLILNRPGNDAIKTCFDLVGM